MPKLIITLILSIFYCSQITHGNEKYYSNCKWDNKTHEPCLEIVGEISNSSKFSKGGINKIIITKKEIDKIGAVDLVDVLKTIPDINITQSGPKGQQASSFMREQTQIIYS